MQKLPVGIQDFAQLRERGFAYVDKTATIHELIDQGTAYFLSRPRRFGKSLLLSTIGYLFEGRRDLFQGLWIDERWDWTERWPVIRISLGAGDFRSTDGTTERLLREIEREAARHEVSLPERSPAGRFEILLNELADRGRRPVVLIDEYDKPVLQVLESNGEPDDMLLANRQELRAFYSVLKDASPHFLLLTGVSRLAKASVFSEMNHLRDITWERSFASICGLSETEIRTSFTPTITTFAENRETSVDAILERLRQEYDGFRFAPGTDCVFNPFSTVNALASQSFGSYWTESGTPEFLVRLMQDSGVALADVDGVWLPSLALASLDPLHPRPLPLLLQTGYLTILDSDADGDYRLGFPNREVRTAFVHHLLQITAGTAIEAIAPRARQMGKALLDGDIDAFLQQMAWIYRALPYQLDDGQEKRYHGLFHAMAILACSPPGLVLSEGGHASGRTDLVIDLPTATWICEFKLDDSPQRALSQIAAKGYADAWHGRGKTVHRIGIRFDSQARELSDWAVAD